ncbi:MAG TPA: hypothetical protein VFG51_00080, partial [Candidatus Saccharimonadia bacterium]|nr:hypothetical protein [Candidatus Saccharimonadia bacterium]
MQKQNTKTGGGNAPRKMTQEIWNSLSHVEREAQRDWSQLSPQLKGHEGYRVEVVTDYNEKRRFIIGRSNGWKPCHLEVNNRRSTGGSGAEKHYKSVRILYKAR